MADDERRMLFDIRGRRRNVIKVVYGVLAVLMGASLFLVVGPVNIGELLNTADEADRSAEIFDEQIERTEARLRQSPNDPDILISLTRASINAGQAKSEVDPTTGETQITAQAQADYRRAVDSWQRYLKQTGGEPNPSLASLMAGTYFLLAQNSRTYPEAFENLSGAADTQALLADARPSLGSWTTLSFFAYLAGDKETGAKAGTEALALANSKNERKAIEKQISEAQKQAKEIQKARKQAAKSEKQQGKEAIQNPLGGLGGGQGSTVTP
jgi:hypothetical protein